MKYEKQLQALVDALNEEDDNREYRIKEARKYDYIEKYTHYGWQRAAAVVKTLDSKVCNGYIKTRVGDIVKVDGTPKRGSKFVKGTIFTDEDRITDAFHAGRLVNFTPKWFRNLYNSRTPNSKR